jgi:hypothetical protein
LAAKEESLMNQMEDSAFSFKTRLLTLEPGMYILRYASQLPDTEVCLISLQQAPLGRGTVDFFPGETVVRNTLAKLGDCIVARVKNGSGTLLVTEYQSKANGVIRTVDLRIDRIDSSAGIMRVETAKVVANTHSSSPKFIKKESAHPLALPLIGYLECQGDVSSNEWLGDPGQDSSIKGFAILWPNKPQGVDIAYSCKLSGVAQPTVLSGQFVGSRQKPKALISAITLALVGPKREEFSLDAQVVFLGMAPQALLSGQEVSAPNGQSRLVAIRVSIVPSTEINAARYSSPQANDTLVKTSVHKAQS